MECYCVTRRKPIKHEKFYTAMVFGLWFKVSSYVWNVIVIGQYTVGLSELLNEFHGACNTAQFQNSRTLGSGNQETLSI